MFSLTFDIFIPDSRLCLTSDRKLSLDCKKHKIILFFDTTLYNYYILTTSIATKRQYKNVERCS